MVFFERLVLIVAVVTALITLLSWSVGLDQNREYERVCQPGVLEKEIELLTPRWFQVSHVYDAPGWNTSQWSRFPVYQLNDIDRARRRASLHQPVCMASERQMMLFRQAVALMKVLSQMNRLNDTRVKCDFIGDEQPPFQRVWDALRKAYNPGSVFRLITDCYDDVLDSARNYQNLEHALLGPGGVGYGHENNRTAWDWKDWQTRFALVTIQERMSEHKRACVSAVYSPIRRWAIAVLWFMAIGSLLMTDPRVQERVKWCLSSR